MAANAMFWKEAAEKAQRERDEARIELGRERMRLAACGVLASCNTEDSLSKNLAMHPDYMSSSAQCVADAMRREMALRARAERAEQERDEAREERDIARLEVEEISHDLSDARTKIWRLEKQIEGLNNFANERYEEIQKVRKERDEAREALADWENAAAHVEADHPDEKHCGCVPVLRKLLADSKRERDEAIADRDILRIDAQREAEHHDRMVSELEKVYKERDEARDALAAAKYYLTKERDDALSQIVQAECRAERFCQERDEAKEKAERYRLEANAMMIQRDEAISKL